MLVLLIGFILLLFFIADTWGGSKGIVFLVLLLGFLILAFGTWFTFCAFPFGPHVPYFCVFWGVLWINYLRAAWAVIKL